MALNLDRYQVKASRLKAGSGGFFRLQDGKNAIRIYTFDHKVTKKDFTHGLYTKGMPGSPKIGEKSEELDRECYIHFGDDGVINCTRKPTCPGCMEAKPYQESDRKADQEVGRKLSARRQFNVNAVDMNDTNAGARVLALPPTVYGDILGFLTSGEYDADELFGAEGRDFVVMRDSKAKNPGDIYKVQLRDAKKSAKLDAELEGSVVDLYDAAFLDPTHVKGASVPTQDQEPEEEEEETEEEGDETTEVEVEETDTEEEFVDEDEDDEEEAEEEEESEATQEIPNGTPVTFEFEDETVVGSIDNWENGVYEVDAGDSIYELSFDELTVKKPVKKKTTKKKTTKKKATPK